MRRTNKVQHEAVINTWNRERRSTTELTANCRLQINGAHGVLKFTNLKV